MCFILLLVIVLNDLSLISTSRGMSASSGLLKMSGMNALSSGISGISGISSMSGSIMTSRGSSASKRSSMGNANSTSGGRTSLSGGSASSRSIRRPIMDGVMADSISSACNAMGGCGIGILSRFKGPVTNGAMTMAVNGGAIRGMASGGKVIAFALGYRTNGCMVGCGISTVAKAGSCIIGGGVSVSALG